MHVSISNSPITCKNRLSPSGCVFKNYLFNGYIGFLKII